MFLTTHSAAGMLIGALYPEPAAAFAAGAASHVVLDMIPHEPAEDLILSYPLDRKHNNSAVRKRVVISLVDLFFVAVVMSLCWILSSRGSNQPEIFIGMISGITGGLLPDCIIMLTFFLDNKFLRWFFDVHNKIHFVLSRRSVPRAVSIPYQFALTSIMILLVYLIL